MRNQGGNEGNQGRNDWKQDGSAGNAGNQGRNAENWGGNDGNKGENLRIGVELMNYNYGEGQETRKCVLLVIV